VHGASLLVERRTCNRIANYYGGGSAWCVGGLYQLKQTRRPWNSSRSRDRIAAEGAIATVAHRHHFATRNLQPPKDFLQSCVTKEEDIPCCILGPRTYLKDILAALSIHLLVSGEYNMQPSLRSSGRSMHSVDDVSRGRTKCYAVAFTTCPIIAHVCSPFRYFDTDCMYSYICTVQDRLLIYLRSSRPCSTPIQSAIYFQMTMMSASVQKTVLITGCSLGGIGDALAQSFHQRGLRVFATARDLSKIQHLKKMGMNVLPLDIVDKLSVKSAVESVKEATAGTLDILVNNAGIGEILQKKKKKSKKTADGDNQAIQVRF